MADVWFPNWKEDMLSRYDFKLHRVGRRTTEINLTQKEELTLEMLCFRLATETTPMTEEWVCQLCVKLCRMLEIEVPEDCSVQASKLWYKDYISRHPFLFTKIHPEQHPKKLYELSNLDNKNPDPISVLEQAIPALQYVPYERPAPKYAPKKFPDGKIVDLVDKKLIIRDVKANDKANAMQLFTWYWYNSSGYPVGISINTMNDSWETEECGRSMLKSCVRHWHYDDDSHSCSYVLNNHVVVSSANQTLAVPTAMEAENDVQLMYNVQNYPFASNVNNCIENKLINKALQRQYLQSVIDLEDGASDRKKLQQTRNRVCCETKCSIL